MQIPYHVKVALIDLDDTLLRTHAIFEQFTTAVIDSIVKEAGPQIDSQEVRQIWDECLSAAYSEHHVNPANLWPETLTRVYSQLDLNPDRDEICTHLQILDQIYCTVPKLHEEALELLESLRAKGLQIAIVSHGNELWTKWKISESGLAQYIDHVHTVDPAKPKDAADWILTLTELSLSPWVSIAIGDSVHGDIRAAIEAGIPASQVVLVRREGWREYGEGEIPEGVIVVRELEEILESEAGVEVMR